MIRIVLGLVLAVATVATGNPASADDSVGRVAATNERRVETPAVTMVRKPTVDGAVRFGHTLVAHPGRWRPAGTTVSYRWMRDGRVLRGATGHRRTIKVADVGHPLAVLVTARAAGYAPTTFRVRLGYVKHRVDVRRTIRYSVRSRGDVPASMATFRHLAQQTYDDPRGWRGRGVRFVPVSTGGEFTLWLSQASLLPSFSSVCSPEWSCRAGRNVVINVERWQHASPAWNAAGRALRGYRHMVVNHETGHFLGYGHSGCPRPGALAPVMMQQSKGRNGCRFNPWPTLAELRR